MFFISRKKFEDEIRKRLAKQEEHRWQIKQFQELEKYLNGRIDRLESRINEIDHKDVNTFGDEAAKPCYYVGR